MLLFSSSFSLKSTRISTPSTAFPTVPGAYNVKVVPDTRGDVSVNP